MQLTRVFTVLSMAAATIAAPAVEVLKRTDGISCGQSQGVLSCCQQKPVLQPVSTLGANIGPTLGGILGIIPAIVPLIVPAISVAAQCIPIIAIEDCATSNICCLAPSSGTTNSAGLIQLLSNNQIAVCPGVTV
ncbi:uncharacterized protein PAC_07351 [Phialocephala subalpina]|uniref:Hydrophobin n=1 Tax=Phialocephala subalpina TaxID=576137 RepID=A0A1L7WXF9_9HELO|nr:uncharacterized protein PAC_07351 [Phialocephala subalpina]